MTAWPVPVWLVPGLAVLVVAVAAAATTAPTAVAVVANPPEPVSTERDDPRAVLLLEVAQRASSRVAYAGVQYVSAWCKGGSASQVVDVTHVPGTGSLVAVHGTAATAGSAVFTAEDGTVDGSDAAVEDGPVTLLARNYHLVVAGRDAVAGRPAFIVEARKANRAVAARLWLDEDTGLALRREVFDSTGAITKASSFVDLTIGHAHLAKRLPTPMPDAWSDRVPVNAVVTLSSAGWATPGVLAPRFQLTDVRRLTTDGDTILHLTYTDGLSAISVFQQRGRLDAQRLDGFRPTRVSGAEVYALDGIPYRATWSASGVVYTVVGDAPDEVVQAVIAGLPHERAAAGVMSRLGRGVDRVASWFNPFS
jgi:sigma-E factor negative regulatory protein RseB